MLIFYKNHNSLEAGHISQTYRVDLKEFWEM